MLAAAIITSPRKVDYLAETLVSVREAGFDPTVVHDSTGRDGPNATYKSALKSLLTTGADRILVFQDDLLVSRGAAEWLTAAAWPATDETLGCCSLYCATPQTQSTAGWWRLPLDVTPETPRPWVNVMGALAFVWPRASAELFLTDPLPAPQKDGTDRMIGAWCVNRQKSLWIHSPSLVQHIGKVSTTGMMNSLLPDRVAASFIDDVAALES